VLLRILGPVEASVGDDAVPLRPRQLRLVLAVLAWEVNRVVPVQRLVELVWPDSPPRAAEHAIRVHISALRTLLAKAGTQPTVETRGPGYLLRTDPLDIDLHQFRDLTRRAGQAGNDEERVSLLERALRLWRGQALADTATEPTRQRLCAAAEEQRLSAIENRNDILLRLGRTNLVDELIPLVDAHPTRERLVGQLMLARYRAGQAAEALDVFRRIRHHLADELGIDPGDALRKLEIAILRGEVEPPQARGDGDTRADNRLSVDATQRGPHEIAAAPAKHVPRQLPAASRLFTGRATELAALSRTLNTDTGHTVPISVISGVGGVGKTWLALHWAQRNVDSFPDGQLFVNLRGFDPSGSPVSPELALRGFLAALGIEATAIPQDLDGQVSLYRSVVADKRMLIVADNAKDLEQVLPLVPGGPRSMVLITSRDRLTGLIATQGADPVPLDVLPQGDARCLLEARLGAQRLFDDPGAVDELLTYCAGLPLALSIVAGRAQEHPDFRLSVFAAELRDAVTRLGALDDDPGASVRAVLSCSYTTLPTEQARVFCLIGLAPGPDISLSAAVSLTALSTEEISESIRILHRLSLLQQHSPGRYRMHDLVRRYACEQAKLDLPEPVHTAALRRLTDFYAHTACGGDRILSPHRPPVEIGSPTPACDPLKLSTETGVLAWFMAEHACLLSVAQETANRGWHRQVWLLAWGLTGFHYRRGCVHEDVAVWEWALTAARHLDDPNARTVIHQFLGHAYARTDRHDEAMHHLDVAAALAERTDNHINQAHIHYALAHACGVRGELQRALSHAQRALSLFRSLGTAVWQSQGLNQTGWYLARLGQHDQARSHCEAALALSLGERDRESEAFALDSLGYIAFRAGEHTRAEDYFQRALLLYGELGNTYEGADTYDRLGHVHAALGDRDRARMVWREALTLYEAQLRSADIERVQHQLALLEGL